MYQKECMICYLLEQQKAQTIQNHIGSLLPESVRVRTMLASVRVLSVAAGGGARSGIGYLFVPNGFWTAFGFAVRPVVVLKSSVTVDQLEVVADKTEATWNTEGGQQYGSGNIEDVN